MTTLSPLPPTPTPEPEETQSPQKARRKLPWVARMLWRPVLAVVIAVHALFLFIPLEKPKPKPTPTPSPIDKNVKVDRVSLIKKSAPPPKAKPRPKTNRRPKTNVKAAPRPRTAPAPRQTPPPKDDPPPDNTNASPTPGPAPPGTDPGSTGSSTDLCGLGDVLGALVSGDPTPENFRNPELYYAGGARKPIVGDMVRVNRYKEGDSEGRDYNSIQERLGNACKSKGATFEPQRQLGDGQLFVITKGSTKAYISLVKGGDITDPITIVVAWNGDPTKP